MTVQMVKDLVGWEYSLPWVDRLGVSDSTTGGYR
jgi:hypothetical protein